MSAALNLIVACAENRVMGRGGRLPWNIPEDQAWFLEHTKGHTVLLGRICYETWPGAHTQGRRPIVITRRSADRLSPHPLPKGSSPALLARSVPEALALTETVPGEVFVCGGARIFEETLPLASRLFLTLIHAQVQGDVLFPEWRHFPWSQTWTRESHDANYRYTFSILEKKKQEAEKVEELSC
jgi:dihydrofolate reductase